MGLCRWLAGATTGELEKQRTQGRFVARECPSPKMLLTLTVWNSYAQRLWLWAAINGKKFWFGPKKFWANQLAHHCGQYLDLWWPFLAHMADIGTVWAARFSIEGICSFTPKEYVLY